MPVGPAPALLLLVLLLTATMARTEREHREIVAEAEWITRSILEARGGSPAMVAPALEGTLGPEGSEHDYQRSDRAADPRARVPSGSSSV